jgi:multiple sugar transport system substrate-binding protein
VKPRVALVGGPMYDAIYEPILDEVEVVVHADHPTLNREVAALLDAGERLDVVSTHGKYAPSQARWLRPLQSLVDTAALAPRAVELCSFRGALLCVPRNVDVRVLWWRTDRLAAAPATWDEVRDGDAVFGFTGRESGLFGLFYELVTDQLFAPGLPGGAEAIELLVELARRAPADLPSWHYDDVDRALLDGRVDCAAAWPGGYAAIAASGLADRLAPAMYPGGRSYAGCHGWAIPQTCADVDRAVALVERLSSAELQRLEPGVPARVDVFAEREAAGPVDAERLAITRRTIETGMLTYPPTERWPEMEDAGWGAINAALRGALTPAEAAARVQAALHA